VSGGDLTVVFPRLRTLPQEQRSKEAADIVRKVAEAVGAAHRLSPPIVHRDLKPANILLQPLGEGKFRPRVADFGIGGLAAKLAIDEVKQGTMTAAQLLATAYTGACTWLYASPQQRARADPDPRDDVYSLGVIWYQLLLGNVTAEVGIDWKEELTEQKVL